ncbi:hypothetical protein [Fictibacillus sp. NRS-1165]|uniref:hypothetical protein n=1 Tax=Fictibacillus sp. NRS-1165 TaxID=3144463 RepID=UPI003D1B5552
MAGMMGAMLSAMLPTDKAHIFILISVLLTVGFALFCTVQFLSDSFMKVIEKNVYPCMIIGCVALFIVFVTFPSSFDHAHRASFNTNTEHSTIKKAPSEAQPVQWTIGNKNNMYLSSEPD